MGVLGGVLAYFVADLFEWRISYIVGGGLGMILLILRINIFESGLFIKLKETNIERGNILMIFFNLKRFTKYTLAIIVGVPLWFVVGVLITFSPEFGIAHGLSEPIIAGKCVMLIFLGQAFGNVGSGLLSQKLKSRKKAIAIFMINSSVQLLAQALATNIGGAIIVQQSSGYIDRYYYVGYFSMAMIFISVFLAGKVTPTE